MDWIQLGRIEFGSETLVIEFEEELLEAPEAFAAQERV